MSESILGDNGFSRAASWSLLAIILVVGALNFVQGEILWALFAFTTAFIAALPAILQQDFSATVPSEILVSVALPHLAQLFNFYPQYASYVAVVGLALIVTIELDMFTEVEMTSRFAVLFVIIASAAVSGIWAVAQYYSDVFLATSFLSNSEELMWDMIIPTALGILGGVVFELYFHEYSPEESMDGDNT